MGEIRGAHLPKLPIFLAIFSFALASGLRAEEVDASTVPVLIMRVEGEGVAKVKKAIGTEEVAGANGKVFPGDRVITDHKSAVFLMINDGSVIKVGLASEFRIEQAKMHERFMSWAFGLVKGSMRAMVEKNTNPNVRFRVNTPSGTIGVRGTEFVAVVDEESKTSYLYTIEGLVSYGAADCEKKNKCLDVRAGETASLIEGGQQPTKPQAFKPKDLFGLGSTSKPKAVDSRMSLFRDARKVTSRFMQDTDDAALNKLVLEASSAMALAQDQAIGRTQAERVAMHAAMMDGSWADIMAAADAYADQNGLFDPMVNGTAENFVAQAVAAKFRLGAAVREAANGGLFGNAKLTEKDPEVKWGSTDLTKLRKNVGYEQAEKAKALKNKLAAETEDFKKIVEFAEAQPAPPPGAEDATPPPPKEFEGYKGKASSKCNRACRVKRVAHEMGAVSEGVVEAFNDSGGKRHEKHGPGRLTKTERGQVQSRHFRKAIPGNACYSEVKDCKLVPCKGMGGGKKCKKGESVKECTSKKSQVRCPSED